MSFPLTTHVHTSVIKVALDAYSRINQWEGPTYSLLVSMGEW